MRFQATPAFWQTWQHHRPLLLKQSLRLMGGNRSDAEDALGATLLRAAQGFQHGVIENERAWFARLVYNACMDIHRARKRHAEHPADPLAPQEEERPLADESVPSPEEQLLEAELFEEIHGRIRKLPASLSVPLMLRYDQRLSYEEIALRLALTSVNARKRVQLARAALRSALR